MILKAIVQNSLKSKSATDNLKPQVTMKPCANWAAIAKMDQFKKSGLDKNNVNS